MGASDQAIPVQSQAFRLAKHEPWRHDTASDLAYSHYLLSNYEAALTWGHKSLELGTGYLQAHIILAATHAQLGNDQEAQSHVEAIVTTRPNFSSTKHRDRLVWQVTADRDHIANGLDQAGLPG